jgi:hypothetical protein
MMERRQHQTTDLGTSLDAGCDPVVALGQYGHRFAELAYVTLPELSDEQRERRATLARLFPEEPRPDEPALDPFQRRQLRTFGEWSADLLEQPALAERLRSVLPLI